MKSSDARRACWTALGRCTVAACHFPLDGIDCSCYEEVSRRFFEPQERGWPSPACLWLLLVDAGSADMLPSTLAARALLEARSHGVHSVCRGRKSCACGARRAALSLFISTSSATGRAHGAATARTPATYGGRDPPPPPDRFRSRPLPPGRPPPPRTITGSRGGLALPRSSCARSSFSPSTSHVGSPARLAAISAGC